MEIENMSITIEDEDKPLLLLCYIHVLYKNFRETILYEKNTISLDTMILTLILKEVMSS